MTEPARLRYICHAGEPYDRFALADWVAQQRAAGIAPDGPVTVTVEHPDREADGNCRWCGDSRNDEVRID
jgi:hypothetical protein